MGETFEEFLKNCLGNTYSGDKEVVEGVFKDLGEWAWKKWKESFYFNSEAQWTIGILTATKKEKKEMEKIVDEDPSDGNFHISNIAIACLGEAEIANRLKKIKKVVEK